MEIVETLAPAQDADKFFLRELSAGLEEMGQGLQCRGGIHDVGKAAAVLVRTECASETAAVSG